MKEKIRDSMHISLQTNKCSWFVTSLFNHIKWSDTVPHFTHYTRTILFSFLVFRDMFWGRTGRTGP